MSHLDDYMYHRRRAIEWRERACGNPNRYEQEEIGYHVGHAWQALIEHHKEFDLPYDATELLEYVGESKCWTISTT